MIEGFTERRGTKDPLRYACKTVASVSGASILCNHISVTQRCETPRASSRAPPRSILDRLGMGFPDRTGPGTRVLALRVPGRGAGSPQTRQDPSKICERLNESHDRNGHERRNNCENHHEDHKGRVQAPIVRQ